MRSFPIFWLILLKLTLLSPTTSEELPEEVLDIWLKNESKDDIGEYPFFQEASEQNEKRDAADDEDMIFDDGEDEDMKILESKGSHDRVLTFLQEHDKEDLDNLQKMIMSKRPREKEEKKKRKDKMTVILKKLLGEMKLHGVTKKEGKGALISLVNKWEHEFLVKKYSEFVEIPDQLTPSAVNGEDGEHVENIAFELVP